MHITRHTFISLKVDESLLVLVEGFGFGFLFVLFCFGVGWVFFGFRRSGKDALQYYRKFDHVVIAWL